MKKYLVTLSADERTYLSALIRSGKAAAYKLTEISRPTYLENLVQFELGAPDGNGAFQPWSEGASVGLIAGFQGGQMIGIYVRMGDRRAQCVQVHVDVAAQPLHGEDLAHPDGSWAAPAAYADGGFRARDDGATQALLIRVDDIAWPLTLRDVNLELTAVITTAAGSARLTVHVKPRF